MIAGDTLESILAPTVAGLGYELWGIERQRSARGLLLRIYIEHPDGITVEDCERVSRQVYDQLEAESLMGEDTLLEISSPGMDRLLFSPVQHTRSVGEQVQIRLRIPRERRRQLTGTLIEADARGVRLRTEEGELSLPYAEIERTRIVPQWPDKAPAQRRGAARKQTG